MPALSDYRVSFGFENEAAKTTIRFPTGGDYRGTGRHERFSFIAADESGRKVEDPIPPSGMGGGLGGNLGPDPGETYTEALLVNAWCAFAKPGKYTITCKRTLKGLEINNIYKFDVWHSRPRLWFPSVHSRRRLCHIPEIV